MNAFNLFFFVKKRQLMLQLLPNLLRDLPQVDFEEPLVEPFKKKRKKGDPVLRDHSHASLEFFDLFFVVSLYFYAFMV